MLSEVAHKVAMLVVSSANASATRVYTAKQVTRIPPIAAPFAMPLKAKRASRASSILELSVGEALTISFPLCKTRDRLGFL